jgi:hypothetical protein
VNRLLAALDRNNQLSVETLKRLYRGLAVRVHPDAPRGSAEEFVKLQAEYEEALAYLFGCQPKAVSRRPRPTSPREAFLRALYLYALMYGRKNWRSRLPALIKLAAAYDEELGVLFKGYRDLFLGIFDGIDYLTSLRHTHRLFLATVRALAWFYETGSAWDRRVLTSFLDDLSRTAGGLRGELGEVVLELCRMIRVEADRPAVSLVTIGTRTRVHGSAARPVDDRGGGAAAASS